MAIPDQLGRSLALWWRDAAVFLLNDPGNGWSEPPNFGADATGTVLKTQEGRLAVWRGRLLGSGQLDVRIRTGGSLATIWLRLREDPDGRVGYAMRVGPKRLTLLRCVLGNTVVLAETDWEAARATAVGEASDQFHLTVALERGRITTWANGQRMIDVDDPEPLPRGAIGFASEGGGEVLWSNAFFWGHRPWADNAQKNIKELVDRLEADGVGFLDWLRDRPEFFAPPQPGPFIAFAKAIEIGVAAPKTITESVMIRSGLIPPDYVHSWAIDLRDIDTFTFKWGKHSPTTSLDLAGGDRLYVVDAAGRTLKAFKTGDTDWSVTLQSPFGTVYDTAPYQRIYLVLEASSQNVRRRLDVEGVLLSAASGASGAEQALLASADTLNYHPGRGPLFWGTDKNGTRIPVKAPWSQPEAIHHYKLPFPPPGRAANGKPDDGWMLVGRNTVDIPETETGFFSLIYYNERTSRMRLYLWNVSLPDATAYQVTTSLERLTQTGYAPVFGALFMHDIRPGKWSVAQAVIPAWPVTKWTFVEFTMLYPMGLDLKKAAGSSAAAATSSHCRVASLDAIQAAIEGKGVPTAEARALVNAFAKEDILGVLPLLAKYRLTNEPDLSLLAEASKPQCYQSVYEERFEPEAGLCNFRLRITVQPVDIAVTTLQFIGGATGSATQVSSADAADLAEKAFEEFEKAGDWYGKGEKIHEKVAQLYDDQKSAGLGGTGLAALGFMAGMGASGWGGILAAVGLWIGIFKEVFKDKAEPMRMAIELAIWGRIGGGSVTPKQPRTHRSYLPGRFSFKAAFAGGQMQTREMDGLLPRHDRCLGLFGFAFDPSLLRFPMGQRWEVRQQSPWVDCLFPSRSSADPNPAPRLMTRQIDHWLPVVFNPYAEIVPVKPHLVGPDAALAAALDPLTWTFGDPAPFPDFLTPSFNWTELEGSPLFDHEPWFEWVQDMSAQNHVQPDPADQSFPRALSWSAGSQLFVSVHSPVKTVKIRHSVFHVSPLTDLHELTADPEPLWQDLKLPRRVEKDFGIPPVEQRDIKNGIRLDVAPVQFDTAVYLVNSMVVHEVHGPYHAAFAQQLPVVPSTYHGYGGIGPVSAHQSWTFRFYGDIPDDKLPWDFNDAVSPFPITDVMYGWDIAYFHYPRTRKEEGALELTSHTMSLRIPVRIDVRWKYEGSWTAPPLDHEIDPKYRSTVYKSVSLGSGD